LINWLFKPCGRSGFNARASEGSLRQTKQIEAERSWAESASLSRCFNVKEIIAMVYDLPEAIEASTLEVNTLVINWSTSYAIDCPLN
jgi:hypothetical protein